MKFTKIFFLLKLFFFKLIFTWGYFLLKVKVKRKKKVLINKTDLLGDFILATESIYRISKTYPEYQIILVSDNNFKEYIKLCPYADTFIYFDKAKNESSFWYIFYFLFKIKKENAEIAVNLNFSRTHFSDLNILYSGANERLGFEDFLSENTYLKNFNSTKTYTQLIGAELEKSLLHELAYHHYFLQKLGIEQDLANQQYLWDVPVSLIGRELINTLHLKYIKIIIAPDVSTAVRQYSHFKYIEIIRKIYEAFKVNAKEGIPVQFIIVSAKRNSLYDCITGANGEKLNLLNLTGKTNLTELFYVLKNADIFIGAESGPAHISLAYKKDTHVIYGGGHVGRFFPYTNNDSFYGYTQFCEYTHCRYNCVKTYTACIEDVNPEQIVKAVIENLMKARVA